MGQVRVYTPLENTNQRRVSHRLGAYRLIWILPFMIVLFVSGCGDDGGGGGMMGTGASTDTILFPVDYQSTFTLVRDCRAGIWHVGSLGRVKVYINQESLDGYTALWNSPDPAIELPLGTVLVKEVYGTTSDCSDPMTEWAVMKKEDPGYNPSGGDWHWQSVGTDRTILNEEDGIVQRCIDCHMGALSCDGFGRVGGYDYTCTAQ